MSRKPRVGPARGGRRWNSTHGADGFTLTEALIGLALSFVVLGFLFSAVATLNRTHRRLMVRHDQTHVPLREMRRLMEELEGACDLLPDGPALRSAQAPDDDGRQTLLEWYGAVPDRPGELGRVELEWIPSQAGAGGMLQKRYHPLPGAESAWTSFPRTVRSAPAAPRISFFDGKGWSEQWPPETSGRSAPRLPRGIRIEGAEPGNSALRAPRMEVALPAAQVITSRIQRVAAPAAPSAPETGAPAP
ncbi:MAG: hypothetical protein KBA51_00715 [Kiritimatiellae bacterium]|nr:hypothetical protein [Kiritimatiellia bacterium]